MLQCTSSSGHSESVIEFSDGQCQSGVALVEDSDTERTGQIGRAHV